ncbi:kh domain containing protein 2 [Dermatophagoides farinae]|uniref:Kh domain containing protein 2 n=1 Tax=Dermatophagoides farinae TaxID=6954 RepID=A0A9D4P6Y2_DERFA|nr:kh domain containing protein 2 [Dermatophagoides farinae]
MDMAKNLRCLWPQNAFDTLSFKSETASSSSLTSLLCNNFDLNSIGTIATSPTSITTTSPSEFQDGLYSDSNSVISYGVNSIINSSSSSIINGEQQQQQSSDKRRKTYCETVSVENSGHVAQIVGKNGCKIKHLRAKYDCYIHTPTANEEPVFIISGNKDKVLAVKQEIIKADSHFANIKEERNTKILQKINLNDAACIRLFIPDKYIGLVVGRNGWFVKDLQTMHNIYIETPKFNICNFFQLFGPRNSINSAIQR